MNIFDFAMQMESDGEAYYRQLADKCAVPGLKRILNLLADDEVGHYNTFKHLKEGTPTDIQGSEILNNAKNVFMGMKADQGFDTTGSEIEMYNKAIEIEKKSEDFYREKAEEVNNPAARAILLKIAEDERRHQFLLTNTKEFLARPLKWVENAEFHHLDDY